MRLSRSQPVSGLSVHCWNWAKRHVMASNKTLPPAPRSGTASSQLLGKTPQSSCREIISTRSPAYSSETYASLLEQENEQLRLRNQQLQLHLSCLESKVNVYQTQNDARKEQADGFSIALKRRDELVGEIAETIISEFQRYKQATEEKGKFSEEITIYSGFDEDSPI